MKAGIAKSRELNTLSHDEMKDAFFKTVLHALENMDNSFITVPGGDAVEVVNIKVYLQHCDDKKTDSRFFVCAATDLD